MIMEFSLINGLGQEYPVQNVETGMLTNVGGLGGSVNNTYAQINNSWVRMSSKSAQTSISGEVAFHSANVYQKESEFTAFMRSSDDIRFKVKTPATTKYIDVDIVSYELKAIGNSTLLCPIQMTARSLWYSSSAEKAAIVTSSGNEFRFPVNWPAGFNDYSDGYLTVNNDGSCEAAFDVEFYGAIDNPEIVLEVNGVEVSKVEITSSIVSGQRIFYSAKDGSLCCFSGSAAAITNYKQTGDTTGLTNLVTGFSLANENFFKLPVGSSKLHITADSTIQQPIMVSVYKYYRAV